MWPLYLPFNLGSDLCGKFPCLGRFYKLFFQMGSFWKYFREGAVFYVICIHAPCKPPVASLLFAKESSVAMAISPCIGNRQSNWRVPSCSCRLRWQVAGLLFQMAGQRQVATVIGELRASCNCHWRVRALKGIAISDGDLVSLYTRKLLQCCCVFKTRFQFPKLWVFSFLEI